MKWTKSYIYTLKDKPVEASIISHQLMVRTGFIRKLSPGIFTYGPLCLRAIRKLEQIIREELNRHGCIELLMPMVQPKEIWEESGRWTDMGEELMRLRDRGERELCLGGTHEEAIVDFIRKDIKSYRHLPVTLYQIQTKFRNEIRPRFGLMRGREFIMKDAYSFDVSEKKARESYQEIAKAYQTIFKRSGLDFRIVYADSGMMGGNESQEFHVLAESGEAELFYSEGGKFAANSDVCPAVDSRVVKAKNPLEPFSEFATPGVHTIADLSKTTGIPSDQLVKTMFFSLGVKEWTPVAILLRGNDEVNPFKLKNLFGLKECPTLLTDAQVKEIAKASPGSCGPVGLKIPIYLDKGVEPLINYMVGANKDGFHLKNVNHPRDFEVTGVEDLRMAREGDLSPRGDGVLKVCRGIEVGHIFYLGTKYSQSMGAYFLDKDGEQKPIEMGCYGIGVGRTIQAAIEQNHDKDGMIWTVPLAPFHVHICLLDPGDPKVFEVAQKIYEKLWARGIECLMDDRQKESPGVKLKDADLLGMPLRLTLGRRSVSQGQVEMVDRRSKKMEKVPINEVVERACEFIRKRGGV